MPAALKQIIPFIIVISGILCFNLYSKDLRGEAVRKNQITLDAMAAGMSIVYPITENFALTEPAKAREVLSHNARAVGESVAIAPQATPAELLAASTGLLTKAAKIWGIDVVCTLVLYAIFW